MTNDRYYDDFLARLQAPYAERRGEVSGFTPLFGQPVEPGAIRSEEMWIQGGENGMQWPETLLIVAEGIARTAHNLDCIRNGRINLLNYSAV